MVEIGYEKIVTGPTQNSATAEDRTLSRQIDELVRISKSERDKQFGVDFLRECEDMYSLKEESVGNWPTFRPKVSIPQLQTLVLNEATDITDSVPKVYITSGSERDDEREKYFQANWRAGFYNNRFLESVVWAMYTNLGWLEVGFNPLARRGKGVTWVESRNPRMLYPDPYAKDAASLSWIVAEDWLYVDDIRRRWPDRGWAVKPRYYSEAEPYASIDQALEFPEKSPLSNQGQEPSAKIFRDNRVRVRTVYCFDNARDRVKDYAGSQSLAANLIAGPKWEYRYPDGRWITECEGITLADGNNWTPRLPDDERGTFPFVRIPAMPALHNIWGVAPVKFTKTLQNLAEDLYAQFYENCKRLNNGVIILKSNCGLQPSDIGWLPGEVLMINPNSEVPQVIAPVPFPQHMLTAPQTLLAMQKELQGYGAARQGDSGGGNVSPDLFDATLWQQQSMTRLRGRLMSEPLQRLAQLVFYIDARYKNSPDRRIDQNAESGFVNWRPTQRWQDFEVELDRGSMRVMSAAAMRSVAGALAKAQMLPTKDVLETFDWPNAGRVAEDKMRELELSAIGRVKRPR